MPQLQQPILQSLSISWGLISTNTWIELDNYEFFVEPKKPYLFLRVRGRIWSAWDLCPLSEMITDNQIESGQLKADLKEMVMYTLLRKHRHQTKKSNLRSLAEIGKSVSSASRLFSNQDNGNTESFQSSRLHCITFHIAPLSFIIGTYFFFLWGSFLLFLSCCLRLHSYKT